MANPIVQKWGGIFLTAVPSLVLAFSAVMKLKGGPELDQGFQHLGFPISLAVPLGILELAVTAIYLIPRTAVLGAILVTGYLGGAMTVHVRLQEEWFVPFLLGVMAWGGLYLRDARIRALIPISKETP
jgi:hypothetical protein